MSAELSFVLPQFTRLTDRQMDRQTADYSKTMRMHSQSHGKKQEICLTHSKFRRSIYKSLQKKRKVTVFRREKLRFFQRKSATKFLFVKTFSSEVVRHSLGLSTRAQMVAGDFQSIFARTTSTIAPTEKKSDYHYRKNHYELYNEPKMNSLRCP